MATLAHSETTWLANEWRRLYGSGVISGIVGDAQHAANGGYHMSIQDNPAGNYSIVRVDDKAPPGTWPRNLAAAIDMSLNRNDMITCHGRLRAAWADRADPRRRYINAWNGWDGSDGAGRYDMVTNTVSAASDDHKWHIHLEVRRRYITSHSAMQAILSILSGQSKEEDDVTREELRAELAAFFDAEKTVPAAYLKNASAIAADTARGLETTGTWWPGGKTAADPLPIEPNRRLRELSERMTELETKVDQILTALNGSSSVA